MAFFSGMALASVAWKLAKGAFSPKVLLGAVVVGSGFFAYVQWDKLSDNMREQEIANERVQREIDTLVTKNINQENTINKIQAAVTRISAINKEFERQVDLGNQRIERIQAELDAIDYESMALENPDDAQILLNDTLQNVLGCIQFATGNKNAKCNDDE